MLDRFVEIKRWKLGRYMDRLKEGYLYRFMDRLIDRYIFRQTVGQKYEQRKIWIFELMD